MSRAKVSLEKQARYKLSMTNDHFSVATNYFKIVLIISIAAIWLYITRNNPIFSILMLDIALCAFLVSLFKTKYSMLFLIHPFILLISSQLFVSAFLSAGDGTAYVAAMVQYLDSTTMSFHGHNLYETLSILDFFKYTSLGIVPVIALPEFIFGDVTDQVYYLWQGTLHIALVTLVVVLALSWRVFDNNTLLAIALFAAVSPSFFDLGAAPTRHIVTFFGVFLLFITHISLMNRVTLNCLLWYGVAILIVLFSRWVLLLPFLLFVFVDLVYLKRLRLSRSTVFILILLPVVAIIMLPSLLITKEYYFDYTAITGAATFSALTQLPLFGWIVKYVYALLAPFPWSDATLIIEKIYSGNWFLFLMHVLSSLMGIYLFMVVILNLKRIFMADSDFKRMILYPIIMSTSIIGGATGFHTYLLIYFPMLAPLFLHKQYRISVLYPVTFVVLLEMFVILVR